jgi:hypothetical protein
MDKLKTILVIRPSKLALIWRVATAGTQIITIPDCTIQLHSSTDLCTKFQLSSSLGQHNDVSGAHFSYRIRQVLICLFVNGLMSNWQCMFQFQNIEFWAVGQVSCVCRCLREQPKTIHTTVSRTNPRAIWHRFYAIQERIACYIEIKKTRKLIKASHRCIDRFINPIIRSVKFDEQKFPTPGLIWRFAKIYLRQEFRRINPLRPGDQKPAGHKRHLSSSSGSITSLHKVFIRWQVEIHVPAKLSESIFYFPHIKYGKYWFHLQKKIFFLLLIFTF